MALVLLRTLVAPARAVDFSQPGPFAVGVTTLAYEKAAVGTGTPRPLPTVAWYPATPGTGNTDPLGHRDATVRRGRFPVVLYSHGSCGQPTESTYLTTALASRGFIVLAPPHPGHTASEFPDCLGTPAVVETYVNRVPDVRYVLDAFLADAATPGTRFAGHVRPGAVAMTGGSFGGFTTLAMAQQEPRLTAALALVPGGTVVLGPHDITIPTMVIGAERDTVVTFAESENAYARLAGPRALVEVLAANHLTAFDSCFNAPLGVSLCVPADVSQAEGHRLILRYAIPFLLRYAKQVRAAAGALRRQVSGVVVTRDLAPAPRARGAVVAR